MPSGCLPANPMGDTQKKQPNYYPQISQMNADYKKSPNTYATVGDTMDIHGLSAIAL